MMQTTQNKNLKILIQRVFCFVLAMMLSLGQISPFFTNRAHADLSTLNLPAPGSMVSLSESYSPAIVMGLNVYPDDPLKFDFIVDKGHTNFTAGEFSIESNRLIKYFLASLTIPEDEMWVNLSPYEKDRIIPDAFGKTEMGRDLLALDYMLKQLSSSLMHPDQQLGSEFWQRVYAKAYERFGSTDIPMNTFNKIWIVPEQATVYEHAQGAFIVDSHLKVMLEEDYLALDANVNSNKHGLGSVALDDVEVISGVSGEIVREILIPEIEKEINEGTTFANLRQIYHSMVLASWYKKKLKDGILGQIYVNQKRTAGVATQDENVNQEIYERYVEAFKEGVFSLIKEDVDPVTQEVIPRKYFSGGVKLTGNQRTISADQAILSEDIRQRVVTATNNMEEGVRLTFGLNAANPTGVNSGQLRYQSDAEARRSSNRDYAILSDIRGFAVESKLDASLVQAVLVNNIVLDEFLERVLRAVQLRNPQTRLTVQGVREALDAQGIVTQDFVSLDVIRESVEIVEDAQTAGQQANTYVIDGIEYSGILLASMQTENFSRQLSRLGQGNVNQRRDATQRDEVDQLIRELNSKGYLSESIKRLSLLYQQLDDTDRVRVNQVMAAEGLDRSDAVDWVLAEKKIDERQRVAIRSMDHGASASVDPFEKMSTLAGVLSVPSMSGGYSDAQKAEFKALAKEIAQFKKNMMYYAQTEPAKPEFDYNQIFDFQKQWQSFSRRISDLVDTVREVAAIEGPDQQLNNVLLTEMTTLPQIVSSEIEGQIAFARGEVSHNQQKVDIVTAINDSLANVIKKRGLLEGYVNFDIQVEGDVSNINVNPTWISLIISNLVNNAHDEIAKQVEAKERDYSAGDIRVGLIYEAENNVLVLTVHDTAGGIPQSTGLLDERLGRQRIFEYGRTQGKDSGTGVGLAEVYHITQLMNWALSLNPSRAVPGTSYNGAEFRIAIPVNSSTGDNAVLSDKVGGIDMNAAMIDLRVDQQNGGFSFSAQPVSVEGVQVDGFIPVIINIAPIQNLPFILGLENSSDELEAQPINVSSTDPNVVKDHSS